MECNKGLVAVVAGLLLAGCAGSGNGIAANQTPRVRLFNGADGQATISATYQDANLVNLGTSPSTAYGSATTDTLIANTTATATILASTGPLFTTSPSLYRENSFYTLYAFGGAFQGYRGLVVSDSQLVAAGATFGIRAVQISTKAPNVDVYVVPGVAPLAPANQVFAGVAYGTVTSAANTAVAVDANGYILSPINGTTSYTVYVTNHGSLTAIATSTATMAQGGYFTVVVYDSPTGAATQTSVAVLGDQRTP
ncbi:MAG: hypothetical protein ACYC96_15475 [Fimbriimonadaceae bacterium]